MRRFRTYATMFSNHGGVLTYATANMAIVLLFSSIAAAAEVQLYSWEADLEDWTADNATLAHGTFGATAGSMAMVIDDLTPGFKNDVGFSGNIVSGPVFDALNVTGAALEGGATDVTLEFDLTLGLSGVTADGFAQLGIFMNSTSDGFVQYGTGNFIGGNALTNFPAIEGDAALGGATLAPTGTDDQYHVTIPLGQTLSVSTGTFYQIGFKSNGGWTGTMDIGIDNMKVTGSTIPEPGTIALLSVAAAFMVVRRRIRKIT